MFSCAADSSDCQRLTASEKRRQAARYPFSSFANSVSRHADSVHAIHDESRRQFDPIYICRACYEEDDGEITVKIGARPAGDRLSLPRVYLETSFISHLTARNSSDPLSAAKQQSSRQWWNRYRDGYTLAVSATVYEECREGDPEMAEKRLTIVRDASLLAPDPAILELATLFLEPVGPLPKKAQADAIHIASASFYGCDFLLTWNFKHIANARIKRRIERILHEHGYEAPAICTPDELMGELA